MISEVTMYLGCVCGGDLTKAERCQTTENAVQKYTAWSALGTL